MYGIFGLPHYVSSLVYFRESPKGEVRRIPIPRTGVNKGKEKGQSAWPRPFTHSYFCSATKCRHTVLSQKGRACSGPRSKPAWWQATSLCSPCAMAAVATAIASITTIRAATINNTRMRFFIRKAPFGKSGTRRHRQLANKPSLKVNKGWRNFGESPFHALR